MFYSNKKVRDHEERQNDGAYEDKREAALCRVSRHRADADELQRRASKKKADWDQGEERWTGTRPSPETEPYEQDDLKQRIKRLLSSGVVGSLAELVMAFVMGRRWLAGTPIEAALTGLGLAIVGMFLLKRAWTAGLKDPSNPKPSFQRRERLHRWISSVTGGAFLGFAVTRVFALPTMAENILLVIFLIGVPLFASGALALASMLRVRNDLALEYQKTRSAFLERLILINRMEAVLTPDDLERILQLSEEIERGLIPIRPVRSIPNVQATLGLLLFLLLSAGTGHALTLQFWSDSSGSCNKEVEVPALSDLATAVTRAGIVDRIEVFGFADGIDALRMPAGVISMPPRPSQPACSTEGEGGGFFKDESDRTAAECEKKHREALAVYEKQRDARAARLVAEIRTLERRPASVATCIYQVISRCIGEGPDRVCLVLTDGVHEACAIPPHPVHQGGARVIVVLVPRNGDGAAAVELMEARKRRMKEYASQVVVIPAYEAGSALSHLINGR